MPVDIEIVEDRSAETPSNQGFIRVRRLKLRVHDEGRPAGDPFAYDVADRDAIDAVLMVLHARNPDAVHDPLVCVRTALRPPVGLRKLRETPLPDPRLDPLVWELPAGLIEAGETGEAAVMETAARETEEEVGYRIDAAAFERLGVPVYLSPGLIGEKLHVVVAEIDRSQPCSITSTEAIEHHSTVEWWPLSLALQRAAEGVIEDCKTELALHRFHARLSSRAKR